MYTYQTVLLKWDRLRYLSNCTSKVAPTIVIVYLYYLTSTLEFLQMYLKIAADIREPRPNQPDLIPRS